MVSEGFCPHGAKNGTPQEVKGSKTAAIQGEKRRNQVWHVSCIRYFHGDIFQRTQDLLRGIWRSARGVNSAGRLDFQLNCQQPAIRLHSSSPDRRINLPGRDLLFLGVGSPEFYPRQPAFISSQIFAGPLQNFSMRSKPFSMFAMLVA
jgi:hypothetical protein